MANIRSVSPDNQENEFDIRLETLDGSKSVNMTIQSARGRSPLQITRDSILQTSTQLSQGGTKYDDFELPFRPIYQEDWSGGRASDQLEIDKTKYFDSGGVNTEVTGKVFLSGLPKWSAGYEGAKSDMPGNMGWFSLSGTQTFGLASKNFAATSGDVPDILVVLKKVGNPAGFLDVGIWESTSTISTGDPDTGVGVNSYVRLDPDDWLYPEGESGVFYARISGAVSSTNHHHVTVTVTQAGTATDYWMVGVDTSTDAAVYDLGTTWTRNQAGSGSLYYVYKDQMPSGTFFQPFEYKGMLYFYSVLADGSNSFLYYSGDRGVAQTNSIDKSYLNDSTKSWTDDYSKNYVYITKGPGSEERYPYRQIVSNTSNSLLVDRDWEVAHTTDTEYVILSDIVTKSIDLGGKVTDVQVAGDYVYFARGDDTAIFRYQAYNKSGWHVRTDTELAKGTFLLAQRETDTDEVLWIAKNQDDEIGTPNVQRYTVPESWGQLYRYRSNLAKTDEDWRTLFADSSTVGSPDVLSIVNPTVGGTTNGNAATKDLLSPVDMSEFTHIQANLKWNTYTAEVVSVNISDVVYDDKKLQPTSVKIAKNAYRLPASVFHVANGTYPADMRWYDGTNWFSMTNSSNGDYKAGVYFLAADTADYVYVGHTQPFDTIYFAMDAASKNSNAATVSVEEWTGSGWYAVSGESDGTSSGGATLAVSGSLTWTGGEAFQAGSDNASNLNQSLHWVRLSFSAGLTATVVEMLRVEHSVRDWMGVATNSLSRTHDAAGNTNHEISRMTTDDYIYVIGQKPFDEIYIDIQTANTETATLSVQYFDGDTFTAVSNMSDGTISTGKTLGVDGSITFDLPDDMSILSVNGVEGYVVRLKPSATLSNFIEIITVSVRNNRNPTYLDLSNAGAEASLNKSYGAVMHMQADDYLYIGGSRVFDTVSTSFDSTVKNNTAATLTAEYYDGDGWIVLSASYFTDGTIESGKPFAISLNYGDLVFNTGDTIMQPCTIDGVTAYWIRIRTSAGLDPVLFDNVGLARNAFMEVALTADEVVSNEWSSYIGAIPDTNDYLDRNGIDLTSIKSVYINVANPNASTTLKVRGGINLVSTQGYFVSGFAPASERITGLELYGTQTRNPWVLTSKSLYQIQTDNNNLVTELPIGELDGLSSPVSGRASATNDVYLWVNIGRFSHRYYNGTLENVSNARDSGLPSRKRGQVSFLYSIPGRVLEGVSEQESQGYVNPNSYDAEEYGVLLAHYGQSVHQMFAAPAGLSVSSTILQTIPGNGTDRLWISVGDFLCHIPMAKNSLNPIQDSAYKYMWEGYLTTGWISAGFLDVTKLFTKVRIMSEGLSSGQKISVYYQTDSGDLYSGWTKMSSEIITSPFGETNTGVEYLSSKRLRLKFLFETNDSTKTPVMEAYILDSILRLPTKNRYTWRAAFSDLEETRQGASELEGIAGLDTARQIDEWSDTPVPLRLHSPHALFDDKIVMIEPPGARPIATSVEGGRYMYQITVTEVSQ